MATGSEILNYQGNAALGAGTAGGIGGLTEYGFGGVKDPLEGISDMLKQQADHATQWNAMEYAQKIKDRNDLYNLFAQNHVDFDTAEADRPFVQTQVDKIRKMMTDNPNLNDAANQAAIRAEFNNLLALKAATKARNADLITQRNEIANEVNPIARDRRQKFYDEQAGTAPDTQIKPYQKEIAWDPNTLYIKPKMKTVTRRWKDPTSQLDMYAEDQQSDMTEVKQGWSEAANIKGPKNNRPYEIDDWYKDLLLNEKYRDPQYILALNAQIDQINKATGNQNTNDPNHFDWIGDVDAEGKVKLNENALSLGASLNAIDKWKVVEGQAKPYTDVVEAKSKVADLTTKTTAADTAAFDLQQKKDLKEIEKQKKQLDIEKEKEDLEDKKNTRAGKENAAKKRVGKVRDLFHSAQDDWRYTLPESEQQVLLDEFGRNRIAVNGAWKVAPLPNDPTALMILSSAVTEEDPVTKKSVTRTVPPDGGIYILQSPDKNPDRALLVGKYLHPPTTVTTADGKTVQVPGAPTYKAYRRSQAGEHLISAIMDYKTGEQYNQALEYYEWAYPGIINNIDDLQTINPDLNVPGNQKKQPPVVPPAGGAGGTGAGAGTGTGAGAGGAGAATGAPDTTGKSPTASGNQGGGGSPANLPPIPAGAIGKNLVTEDGDTIPVIIIDDKIYNRMTNSPIRALTAKEKKALAPLIEQAKRNRKK